MDQKKRSPAAVTAASGANISSATGRPVASKKPSTPATPAQGGAPAARSAASAASAAPRLAKLFAGNESAHGTHGEPDPQKPGELKWTIKKSARTLREPATEETWRQHLLGERPLGVIPIRKDGTCGWGSIDLDEYDVDLLAVVERVERARLLLVPCVSKSGGLHLLLFLEKPEPAKAVQAALSAAAAALNLGKCEIFPKQTRLDLDAVGNWMCMPYLGTTFGGKLREQRGLKRTGAEMMVEEFASAAEKARTTLARFGALVDKAAPARRGRGGGAEGVADFADGPPCLQRLIADGKMQGDGRDRFLFMVGVYARRKYPSDWKERLDEYNRTLMATPLPSENVTKIQKSLSKKNYEYTCKAEPMCGVCDSAKCRTRVFGVGGGGTAMGLFEKVEISEGEGDETVWKVTVGGKTITLSSDEMLSFRLFSQKYFAHIHRPFPYHSQKGWEAVLNELPRTLLPAKRETSRLEQLKAVLTEYLTNRMAGKRREDMLQGRTWHDDEEGRIYFKLRGLKEFIEKDRSSRFRGMSHNKLGTLIRDLHGDTADLTVAGASVFMWWVPSSDFQPPPQPPPQRIEGEDVF